MSAGVSEQRIKGQGNQGKNVEERSIPWSQQVDEAFFEVVSSPNEANLQGATASGTQFQYPPFNIKDGNSGIENYQGGNNRRNNHQNDGCNQQTFNSYSRKYENENTGNSKHNFNSSSNYSKRSSNYDDNYKSVRNNVVHRVNNDTAKSNIQRGLQNLSIDNHERTINNKGYSSVPLDQSNNGGNNKNKTTSSADQQNTSNVKPMTWASIASQPAKPTLRSNLISSTLKKKGPGMPPPPMVPGKHNMDINTWDTPKNGPTLVPPPLPPVIPVPIMETSIFNHNKTNSNEEKSGAANYNENDSQRQKSGFVNADQFENRNSNNNWTATYQSQNKLYERNNQHQSTKSSIDNNVRPPWVPQYQQQQQHYSHQNNQNQSSYQANSKNINSVNHPRGGDFGNITHSNRQESSGNNYPFVNNSQHTDPPLTNSPTPSNTSSTAVDVNQEQRQKNNYNPQEMDIEKANLARFFVIKSYSEDDIYRSIKYKIWCSTERGNQRLDEAFKERQRERGFLYLLFSVNGSGHFCGIAQMMTSVDYNSVSSVWSQKKWKGTFKVKWLYVKDVPNLLFRRITIESNENKPVTNSRDTQEVPNDKGILVMKIIHEFNHVTSLIDDFWHYEKRQEEEKVIKKHDMPLNMGGVGGNRSLHRSGGGDFSRGDSYDNNKNNSYHRDRKNYNRSGYQNNYDNRRGNDNSRNVPDTGPSPTNHNNNRENNCGDCYNSKSSGFRNNYRRDDRNEENSSNSGENRGLSGNFPHRTDNRILSSSFRERDRESYKRKGGWRSTQRSIESNEKAEN